jgi:hypothetical protein
MSEPLNLGDNAIAAATAGEVITSASDANGASQAYLSGLGDIAAACLQVNFNYGSGGTSVKITIETTLDQGVTWIEVARLAFTTTSAEKLVNLSALTPKVAAYSAVALSDDTAVDGILGDRWRAKKIVLGTYAGNTSVSVRMQAR